MHPWNNSNNNNNDDNDRGMNDDNGSNSTTGTQRQPIKTERQQPTNQSPSAFAEESPGNGTMTEAELVAMGIDINEIRAQRDIERRLEEETRQQEYAERLQAEYDREVAAMTQQQTTTPAVSSNAPFLTYANLESGRVASVQPSLPSGNQPVRNINAPTTSSTITTIIDIPDENSSTSSTNNTSNHSQTSRPSAKRHIPIGSSSSQPKIRRPRGYWLLPGESMPGHDSDDDDDDDDMALGIAESIRSINNLTNNASNSINNSIIDRHNAIFYPNSNSSSSSSSGDASRLNNVYIGRGPSGIPSSNNLGQSTTADHSTGSSLDRTPTILSRAAKAKGLAKPSAKEIISWMNTVPDVDAAPDISNNTLDDLDVTLMEHQQVGFKWMYQQEASENQGGLLCDDMGLGKTIQSLAIIVGNRFTKPAPNTPKIPTPSKSTLVVCPINLMSQWENEIKSKTKNVSVHVNHASRRTYDPKQLASYDVIITSYTTLASDYSNSSRFNSEFVHRGGMFSLAYHRVILDEAHSIKNINTVQSRACMTLIATHKWCLTATPIQNALDDMYALVKFLGISPYDNRDSFRSKVSIPLSSHDSPEKEQAKKIFKSFMLRRSKNLLDGNQSVIKLPERQVYVTYVDFTPDERTFYESMNTRVLSEVGFRAPDTIDKLSYATMMSHLLSLRQICLHPALVGFRDRIVQMPESFQMNIAKSISQRVVDRLLSMKNELPSTECPICMDVADQPQIISGCGHILCAVCLNNYMLSTSCSYNGKKSCPECRGILQPDHVVPVEAFLKIHDAVSSPSPSPAPSTDATTKAQLRNDVYSSKINTMLDILEKTRRDSDGKDKTIIFSNFSNMLTAIEKALTPMNINYRRYDGTVAIKKRGPILSEFETNPSLPVLLISTKCGAVGLNLTMANKVIIMDVGCNPLMETQAIGRVHRIGQKKKVEVHRLVVRNTVEERLMVLQARKQEMSDSALDGRSRMMSDAFTKVGRDEWLYLFGNIPLPGSTGSGSGSGSGASSIAGPSRSH